MAEEKYQTQLTGAQVDDALQQLNQRVAEGWAVGTKDGTPVSSGSQYYNNNAKYYAGRAASDISSGVSRANNAATRAEAAANRAESAVPTGTAGAVFFDRTQNLTDGQKGQVKSNIGAGAHSENLLTNGFFLINQRGKVSYSGGSQYTLDGWYHSPGESDSVVTWLDNGANHEVRITNSTNVVVLFYQNVYVADLIGKNLTASINVTGFQTGADWLLQMMFLDIDGAQVGYIGTALSSGLKSMTYAVPTGTYRVQVRVRGYGGTIRFDRIKLELGTISTLMNDPVPNVGTELVKAVGNNSYANVANDPYANHGVGLVNPNVLDNWYFVGGGTGAGTLPINQNKASGTVSASGRFIDRWYINSNSSVTIYSGSIRLNAGSGMRQFLIPSKIESGQPYTFSVRTSAGGIYWATGVPDSSVSGFSFSKHIYPDYLWVGIQYDSNKGLWDVDLTTTNGITITAVKLEKGSVSTLATTPAPDYGEELRKCRFYYRVWEAIGSTILYLGGGFANSATQARIPVDSPMLALSSTPDVGMSGTISVLCNGTWYTVTEITSSWPASKESGLTLFAAVSSGLTQNAPCVLRIGNNSKITYAVNQYL